MSCSNDEVTVDPHTTSIGYVRATFKAAPLPELSFSARASDSGALIREGKVGAGDSLLIWAIFDYGTSVRLTIQNVTSLGEYEFGYDSVEHLLSQCNFSIYSYQYQFVNYFTTNPNGSGKITIEELDSDHVKGSFDAEMYTEDDSLVAKITNGSFYQFFE